MKFFTPSLLFLLVTITSCGQVDPNKQIDEGAVEDNQYTNENLGWTIDFPEGWAILSRKENEAFQERGKEAIEDAVGQEVDASDTNTLIGFKKDDFNIFQSSSQPYDPMVDGNWNANNNLLKKLIYNTYRQNGITVDSTATYTTTIDDLDFNTFEFTLSTPQGEVFLRQVLYARLINGYDFGVNINYNNETDKKELEAVWLQSKFRED